MLKCSSCCSLWGISEGIPQARPFALWSVTFTFDLSKMRWLGAPIPHLDWIFLTFNNSKCEFLLLTAFYQCQMSKLILFGIAHCYYAECRLSALTSDIARLTGRPAWALLVSSTTVDGRAHSSPVLLDRTTIDSATWTKEYPQRWYTHLVIYSALLGNYYPIWFSPIELCMSQHPILVNRPIEREV